MGFRFRKSISIMPGVRLNFGKKSVGVSAGNKWGGVSVNSRTGTTYRVSVPGTGASYTTSSKQSKRTSSGNEQKPDRPLLPLILFILFVLGIGGAIKDMVLDKIEGEPYVLSAPVSSVSPPVRALPIEAEEPDEPLDRVELAPFVAAENSSIYHANSCTSLEGKASENFAQFLTAEAAALAGYAPHSVCTTEDAPTPAPEFSHAFVASRRSNKYHVKGCPYAQQIDPENIIYFESNAAARDAGYEECKECMG